MNKNNKSIADEIVFKVGKVISVDGRTIEVLVDKNKNLSHTQYNGELVKNISVNGYIKIIKGFTQIIGKVDGEFVSEDKNYSGKDYKNDNKNVKRTLKVSLIGFLDGNKFEGGVKELPMVFNECYLLSKSEFSLVHDFIDKIKNNHVDDNQVSIKVGCLANETSQVIRLGINKLFASHIGIFGNTGSGKSYTLAKIYHELFNNFHTYSSFKENASFFLIDFNGEYLDSSDPENDNVIIEPEFKKTYELSTDVVKDKYPVPKKLLYDATFWSVFLDATEKTQAPFLDSSLKKPIIGIEQNIEQVDSIISTKLYSLIDEVLKKKNKTLGMKIFFDFFYDLVEYVTDSGKIYEILDFIRQTLDINGTTGSYYLIDKTYSSNMQYDQNNISSIFLDRVKISIDELKFIRSEFDLIPFQIKLKYYESIIRGYSNQEHLGPLMKRLDARTKYLKKVINISETAANGEKLFVVVSLRSVNIHIKKILPLLLCKQLYEEKKKRMNQDKYLNIIIDEAHNILSKFSERESDHWKDYRLETFEEIIKEGRKFGVFMTIASQRPADISPTIISQLHNYFLHRLINSEDIRAVEKTIAYLDKISFESLPILPTGSCILAGQSAKVPVLLKIGSLEKKYEPFNKTMNLIEKWVDQDTSET